MVCYTCREEVVFDDWLENQLPGKDVFAEALARRFARFLTFLGASKMDTKAVAELARMQLSPWFLQV